MSSVTNPANSAINNPAVGTIAWTGTGNIFVSDNIRAQAALLASEVSKYLVASDFNFILDDEALITGVQVEWEISQLSGGGDIKDNKSMLQLGSTTFAATDKADGVSWPGADAYKSQGGAGDLWGETSISPLVVNSNRFGAALSCKEVTAANPSTGRVDHCRITVFYSAPILETVVTTVAVSINGPEVQFDELITIVQVGISVGTSTIYASTQTVVVVSERSDSRITEQLAEGRYAR